MAEREVSIREAQTLLPDLLKFVAEGHSITITDRGMPVAVLEPYIAEKHAGVKTVIAQIFEFRDSQSSAGLTIQGMIEEGRR